MFTCTDEEILEVLQRAVENGNVSAELRSYSGRGMYGRECVGVSIDGGGGDRSFVASAMYEAAQQEDPEDMLDDLLELFSYSEVDSLGFGTILYFPRWKMTDEMAEMLKTDDED